MADVADLFRRLTTGVYVIGVAAGERRNAFTAAWLTPVSFDPLLLALSVNPEHFSYPLLVGGGGFVVNVLRRDGCPLTVTSEDGRTVFAEGKDFEPVRDPKLWTPETPHLYEVTLELKTPDGQVDSVSTYFGLRTIARGRYGDAPFERIGRVALPVGGTLDVWRLQTYGGGIFLPVLAASFIGTAVAQSFFANDTGLGEVAGPFRVAGQAERQRLVHAAVGICEVDVEVVNRRGKGHLSRSVVITAPRVPSARRWSAIPR